MLLPSLRSRQSLLLGLALLLLTAGSPVRAQPALPCAMEGPCVTGPGTYAALPPQDWDGEQPLPLLLFFIDNFSAVRSFGRRADVQETVDHAQALMVLPTPEDGLWNAPGTPWPQWRDERFFLRTVEQHVRERFSVLPERVILGGFRGGASVAYDLLCRDGARVDGLLSLSGGVWHPLPQDCQPGPYEVLHLHADGDPLMPLAGRPYGQDHALAAVPDLFALLADVNGCPAEPVPVEAWVEGQQCRRWEGCQSGARLTLCVQPPGASLDIYSLTTLMDRVRAIP